MQKTLLSVPTLEVDAIDYRGQSSGTPRDSSGDQNDYSAKHHSTHKRLQALTLRVRVLRSPARGKLGVDDVDAPPFPEHCPVKTGRREKNAQKR